MKTPLPSASPSPTPGGRSVRAFTLPEIMTVMALFTLVIAGMLSSQLFGMRMYRISETKLLATAGARRALDRVRDEIRAGKLLKVGNGNDAAFAVVADNEPQIGNALQIHATTDTNTFVRYYLDANAKCLKRLVSGSGEVQVVANYITNRLVFQAQDFMGNVLTNRQNNRVIQMTLEFYQWEFPAARVGSGGMYDYYRLQTRITRRAIE